jgi:hypothetical protein
MIILKNNDIKMKSKNPTMIYLDENDWMHFRWVALTKKRTASAIIQELVREYLEIEENKKIVVHLNKLGNGQIEK